MTEEKKATYADIERYLMLQQIFKADILAIHNNTKRDDLKKITRICKDAFDPNNANDRIDRSMKALVQEFKNSSIRKELGRLREAGYNKVRAKAKRSVGWIERAKAAYNKIKGEKKKKPPKLSSSGKRNLF